ncbi:homocysteine S-methyltransferase family protein [Actinocrispum wychmicini]|uniref:S-methylmethionine-dependent homocysteine/selenocysteine methylase n=1 Tax=Actinocrispum wychmicini TaxID=1213861 RepID=A0A4R2JZZ0_9PSEU|nr:homocysteine S-methyltransferase family protein [Actinocrispum wychmicini]TCO59645.1 S-methylmethionine-dependent homocysteine/selenocysteine methylase [Actinocrispum wychmicini]
MSSGFSTAAPILLDGAVATELQRAGVPVHAPWWTTAALRTVKGREVLRSVHAAHLRAGAQVITANTFRCHGRALRPLGADPAALVRTAVGLARDACADTGIQALVAGSVAPVADCYRPDLVPPDAELRAEHGALAADLVRSGVDLVLVETMNTVREARIALAAVLDAGARGWVSFVCGPDGRLLSGERLRIAARTIERDGADTVLVNCTSPTDTTRCLAELRSGCAGRIGAYPNIEDRSGVDGHVDSHLPAELSPVDFANLLARWRAEFGPDVLGGCCGTSPDHLRAAAARLRMEVVA